MDTILDTKGAHSGVKKLFTPIIADISTFSNWQLVLAINLESIKNVRRQSCKAGQALERKGQNQSSNL